MKAAAAAPTARHRRRPQHHRHHDGRPVFRFEEIYCKKTARTFVVSRVRIRKNTRVEMKDIVELKIQDGKVAVIDPAAVVDKGKGKEPVREESESDSSSSTDEDGEGEGDPGADELADWAYQYNLAADEAERRMAEGGRSGEEEEEQEEEEDEDEEDGSESSESEEEEDVRMKDT